MKQLNKKVSPCDIDDMMTVLRTLKEPRADWQQIDKYYQAG
jgi:hypothetical protein